jgi:hypothetical protein
MITNAQENVFKLTITSCYLFPLKLKKIFIVKMTRSKDFIRNSTTIFQIYKLYNYKRLLTTNRDIILVISYISSVPGSLLYKPGLVTFQDGDFDFNYCPISKLQTYIPSFRRLMQI